MLGVLGALSSQGCIVAARRISFITKAVSSFAKSQHSVWTSLDHVPTADAQQKEEQTDLAQATCSTPAATSEHTDFEGWLGPRGHWLCLVHPVSDLS